MSDTESPCNASCSKLKRKNSTELEYDDVEEALSAEPICRCEDELNERCLMFRGITPRKGASLYVIIYQMIQEQLKLEDAVKPEDIGRIWVSQTGVKVEFSTKEQVNLIMRFSGRLQSFKFNDRKVRVALLPSPEQLKLKELQDLTLIRLREFYKLQKQDIELSGVDQFVFLPNTEINPTSQRNVVYLQEAVFLVTEKFEELSTRKKLGKTRRKQYTRYKDLVESLGWSVRRDQCLDRLVRSFKRRLDLSNDSVGPSFKRSRGSISMKEEED
ncbi:unnamed protein product [Bursaphelenchus xylophilus]|uniref:(pine wood nematode) hypothetical protein n=1 Tax=Bursaphelenchus xylophilus TaxID=6326 RepID=A0A1I7RMK2_BURXY|nr:unnamed protein product [Bursaphelenchus xylophilus]CAG9125740.1 unnamed protein product [Bursaphelenchus xylophilus]